MKAISDWLLKRLSRVTSSGRFVPEIDGLRFVAIMSVVIFHMYDLFWKAPCAALWTATGKVVGVGWFGVELFFIISGFILSMPFAEQHVLGKSKVSLKKYFVRRLTRLEPPYIINLFLLLGLLVLIRQEAFADVFPHFLASVFYSHNQVFDNGSLVNPAAWSLEVEVQFYILAPVLSLVYLVRGKWLRRAIIVAGMAINLMASGWAQMKFPAYAHRLQMSLACMLPYFLVGFLLTDVYLASWKGAPRKSYLWDLIGLAAWASIPLFLVWDQIWLWAGISLPEPVKNGWELLYTVGFGSLLLAYMAVFRGRILNRIISYPWIVAIGGMCYSIYLYHQTLLDCFRPLIRPDTSLAESPLVSIGKIVLLCVIVVGCSAVLFVTFEKPFMYRDWPRKVKGFAGAIRRRAAAAFRRSAGIAQAVEVEIDEAPAPSQPPSDPSSLRK